MELETIAVIIDGAQYKSEDFSRKIIEYAMFEGFENFGGELSDEDFLADAEDQLLYEASELAIDFLNAKASDKIYYVEESTLFCLFAENVETFNN